MITPAELLLHDNEFTGTLPDLSENKKIRQLELSDNFFVGSIDGALFELENLEKLYLNGNLLTGEIPETFEQNEILEDIFLDNNLLSGTIPEFQGNPFPNIRKQTNPILPHSAIVSALTCSFLFLYRGDNVAQK